jgi:uncharacterized coiled-coil protein SlyX
MAEERLRRIEEGVSFVDQRVDGLDAALRDVGDRLLALLKRLERIESRLDAVERESGGAGSDGDEGPPPHSGMLPGGR